MDLNNFIRRVRTSRTSAQMSEMIEFELANIRAELKKPKVDELSQIIAKLTCAYLWGINISWGYAHICTLCSTAKLHAEKRVAYLALILTYNDAKHLFSLTTNALSKDLVEDSVSTHYKVSLALNAVCTVCTKDTAHAFSGKVHALISNGSSIYLRKKAIMAACAIVQASPDLAPLFVNVCAASLSDKAHPVVLAGCELGISLLDLNDGLIQHLYHKIYHLLKVLSKLCAVKSFQDHDIGGLCDPLLQHAITRFLGKAIRAAYVHNCTNFLNTVPSLQKYFAMVFTSILERISSPTVNRSLGMSIGVQSFMLFADIPDSFFFSTQTQHGTDVIPEEDSLVDVVMAFLTFLIEAVTNSSDLISCSVLEALQHFVLQKRQTIGMDSVKQFMRFSQLLKRSNPAVRKRVLDLLSLLVHKKDIKTYIADLFEYLEKEADSRTNRLSFANSIRDIVILSALSAQEAFDYLFRLLLLVNNTRNNAVSQAILAILSRKDVTLNDKRHFISAFAPHRETMISSLTQGRVTALVDIYLLVIATTMQNQISAHLHGHTVTPPCDDLSAEFAFTAKISGLIMDLPETDNIFAIKLGVVRTLALWTILGDNIKQEVLEFYSSILHKVPLALLNPLRQYMAVLNTPSLLHTLIAIPCPLPRPPNIRSTKRYTNPAQLATMPQSVQLLALSFDEDQLIHLTLSTIGKHMDVLTNIDSLDHPVDKTLHSTATAQPVFINDDIKVYASRDTENPENNGIKVQVSLYAVSQQLKAKIQYSVPITCGLDIVSTDNIITGPLKAPIIQYITLWPNMGNQKSSSQSASAISDSDAGEPVIPAQTGTDEMTLKEIEDNFLTSAKSEVLNIRFKVAYVMSSSIKNTVTFSVSL